MLKKYIGDKAFYRFVLAIAVPIMLQNGITNFVNMLDNIMVGRIGTAAMTGVSVANLLIFVFTLCIFGAVAGVGIFGAQYYGKNDQQGLQYSLRFKIILSLILTVSGILLFQFFGDTLIGQYLKGEGSAEEIAKAFDSAKDYLRVMMLGFIPFAITQSYSSTLRETGETMLPMKASIIAVIVNLCFNYVLIFGVAPLNIPAFGATGAAIATVLSRFVEAGIVIIWTHNHKEKNPYIVGLFKNFTVPFSLSINMLKKAVPLILNETLWATGVAMLNQSYSTLGVDVVAANNIAETFWKLFSVVFIATGSAIAIIVGNMLGAGKLNEVMDTTRKLITFGVLTSVFMGGLYIIASPFIPLLYNTEQNVRTLATGIMILSAIAMPFDSMAHSSYFTLRSGGKSLITFIFDCGFMWCVSVPLAFVLAHYTNLDVLTVFAIVQVVYFIKGFLGLALVRKGDWIRNIVND